MIKTMLAFLGALAHFIKKSIEDYKEIQAMGKVPEPTKESNDGM